jgi:two-component system response regulator HydG
MSQVLLIDDEPRFCQATSETLRQRGHDVTTANSLAAAREILSSAKPEVIFLDLMLPDGNGLELLEQIDEQSLGHVVIITGHPAIKSHIESLAGPTVSYVTKPVGMETLVRIVEELEESSESPQDDAAAHFGYLVGESAGMRKIYESIERIGPTEGTVLIEGESGTGKELVARALHKISGRLGRFVPTNCGALAGELVASELFGHEKGSFTGATRQHRGVFERATGGTLFLDEISEMASDLQTYLLRSLESGEIVRVGGEQPTAIDTRLIAATNRALADAVRDGDLREDLFYRLSEFVISLPPLRTRRDDIELLVKCFVEGLNRSHGAAKRPSEAFLERCRKYDWPGNVRELKHVVHRAYLLAADTDGELVVDKGFESPFAFRSDVEGVRPGRAIRDVERELIHKTLDYFEGDKKAAADSLGISLKTLYNRLSEYKTQSSAAAGDRHA